MKSEIPIPQDRLTRGGQISKGLDRLKVGFYVEFNKELLFDVLTDAKALAQEQHDSVALRLGPDEDYDYICHTSGKSGGYNFHISRADVDIFISTRKDFDKTPNVWVDIGSASCWSPGYHNVLSHVRRLVWIYGGKVIRDSVSEVHICCDCIGLEIESLNLEKYSHWITRANKFNSYYDRAKFTGISLDQSEGDLGDFSSHLGYAVETGITIGQGDIALRVYDKVFEIQKNGSKSSLFASVWGKDEFNEEPVTRVEFQLRKEVLKQFRIKSLEDLFAKMNSLWQYCTTDWARFCGETVDRENRHQDRAKIHSWWKRIQKLTWDGSEFAIRKKPLPQKDKKQLVDVMIGCALNVAAIDGCDHRDIELIKETVLREVEDWCDTKSKIINQKTGLCELQERMKKKVNEVWPYGYGEVHGPTRIDAECGFVGSDDYIITKGDCNVYAENLQ